MKIGILTFFESDNYGTVLQAYALQEYLKKLGHEVILIHLERNVSVRSSYYKNILRSYRVSQRMWNRIIMTKHSEDSKLKKLKFENFRKQYLNITRKCYKDGQEFLVDSESYDLIISGGDQIWNPYHKVFSLDYMCDFLPETIRCISYGSSFGVDRIEENEISNQMRDALLKYDSIAVREKSGVDIIRRMGLDAKQVVDPVFLDSKMWKKFITEESPENARYGLVYALVDFVDEDDKKIRNYAKNNHLKMIILPENRRNCMNLYKKEFALSPQEFINYIAHSEVVFTNSFHGLAFALLFKKKVVLLNPTTEEASKKQIRLTDLLKQVGLDECDFASLDQELSCSAIDEQITKLSLRSQNILKDALHADNK